MKNQEIARILYEIAEYLQMEGVAFKPQAYRKAGLGLETFDRDIEDLYREEGLKGLKKIPGVGESIAQKIEEYLNTGKIKYYEDFKKKIPASVEALTAVEGVGPRKVKIIYEELGIKNLDELEKAAEEGKIRELPGFGEKTEKKYPGRYRVPEKREGQISPGRNIAHSQRSIRETGKVERS